MNETSHSRLTHVSFMSHSGAEMTDFAESYVLLNVEQARGHVGSSLGKKIPRATLYRWRNFLRLEPPYSLDAVKALTLYGIYIRAFRDAELSKQKTLEVLREQGL